MKTPIRSALSLLTGLSVSAVFMILSGCATLKAREETCDGEVVFLNDHEFVVNENATKLICGDDNLHSWKKIPPNQQKLMLQGLLREVGYHRPTFEVKDGKLLVSPGARARIKSVRFLNAPDEFFDYRPPEYAERPITSATLDEIEKWALNRLHEVGYPCSRLETLASVEDESVLLNLKPGHKRAFPIPRQSSPEDLNPLVEQRYRAFFPGRPYQASLLKLSSQRMEADGVATRSIYDEKCEDNPGPEVPAEIPITHRTTLGPARMVQLGFGFSTEEYFLFRGVWKNTRVGSQASQLSAILRTSFIEQKLALVSNLYFSENHPRWYLAPKFTIEHAQERNQEYNRVSTPFMFGWSNETFRGALRAEAGPRFTYENVFEGPALGEKRLLLGDTFWNYKTHDYEIRQARPSEGFEATFDTSSVLYSLEEGARAHKAGLRGTVLWNLGHYDPARWIFGLRGKLQTVFRDADNLNLASIPIEYFTWLGGEDDLRGFGRRELPLEDNGRGALSSAYLGAELRTPVYLMEGLDPLVFLDVGMLGFGSAFHLDTQLYYSPGIGARYQSPVGSIRTTLARGFIPGGGADADEHEHIQFFISLGREF